MRCPVFGIVIRCILFIKNSATLYCKRYHLYNHMSMKSSFLANVMSSICSVVLLTHLNIHDHNKTCSLYSRRKPALTHGTPSPRPIMWWTRSCMTPQNVRNDDCYYEWIGSYAVAHSTTGTPINILCALLIFNHRVYVWSHQHTMYDANINVSLMNAVFSFKICIIVLM